MLQQQRAAVRFRTKGLRAPERRPRDGRSGAGPCHPSHRYPHRDHITKGPDTAGEITTRRKEWIIPRILVEMDRTRALFLSELALRCEQIFPHRFCPIEFASSIGFHL